MMQNIADARHADTQGYVLAAADGERLINRGGDVVIKVDPSGGSQSVSLGTQQVPPGVGIPRHRHAHMDEFIYVLEGSGTVILNDARHSIEKGGTIFIPKGSWHAFENPGGELVILWAVSPTGQEEFFRAISSRPGEPSRHLTPEQTLAIREQVEADQLKRLQSHS
jgi:quercetin dioxygenase-like cupin family protein